MMPMKMKALVKANPTEGLWKQDVPIPEIGEDDVLIRIKKTGICGTGINQDRLDLTSNTQVQ